MTLLVRQFFSTLIFSFLLLGCNVTTYPARDGQQLISNIESALNDLHDVIKTM